MKVYLLQRFDPESLGWYPVGVYRSDTAAQGAAPEGILWTFSGGESPDFVPYWHADGWAVLEFDLLGEADLSPQLQEHKQLEGVKN